MGTADKNKVRWYKITGPKGEPLHGGSGDWSLPVGKKPGKWMPEIKKVVACESCYHLIEATGIIRWLPYAPQTGLLWEAEGRGDSDKEDTKTAFAQARLIKLVGVLDEVSMRLAAADMAERVLPIFYKVHPKDNRPALAIQAARDFALGKISRADAAAYAAYAADAADYVARADAAYAARAVAYAARAYAARAADADAAAYAAYAARAAAYAARAAAYAARAADAAAAAAADAADAAADADAEIIISQSRKRAKELNYV